MKKQKIKDQKLSQGLSLFRIKTKKSDKTSEILGEEGGSLQFALEASGVGVWELNFTDHSAYRSPGVDRIFGYTKISPEWTYEIFLEHILPEDRTALDLKFRHAIDTLSDWSFECRIRRCDGQVRWIWVAGGCRKNDQKTLQIAGIVQDITERKRAEEKVLHLASFPKNNPLPVIEFDKNGKKTFSNLATEEVLNKNGMTDKFELFLPEDFGAILELLKEGKRKVFDREMKINDSIFLTTIAIIPEFSVARIYAQDITQGKRLEEELKRYNENLEERVQKRSQEIVSERKRLFDLLEALPVYVVLLDKDYRVPFANKFFRERFGESRGLRCYEYLFNRNKECENCETYKVMKTSAPHHWEWEGPDGRRYDIYDFPFKDTDGSQMIMEMGIDITEQRRAVKELIETKDELDRTKRLSDIGALAATVAHELRNPLAAIGMAAHNIKRKAKTSDIDKHIINIDKKIAESDQIINNLLFYSRLKPPYFEKIDIFNILEESIESVKEKHKRVISISRNINLLKGVLIQADQTQIREVFNNILNNACDAVSADKGEIKIVSEVNDEVISVFIEDNGPGIDDNIVDKIFDPFFTTKSKGTGLGLSVCKQIITMHKGEIGVKRGGPAKGACIFVRLPRKE